MTRRLRLGREVLTELSTDELRGVVAATGSLDPRICAEVSAMLRICVEVSGGPKCQATCGETCTGTSTQTSSTC
jgi:hypothetical protein